MVSSQDQIKHLAQLARLGLTADEIEKFAQEFKKILAYVQKLEAVDITRVKETNQVNFLENIFRADRIKQEIKSADLLKSAPVREKNQFKVKSIFGEKR